MGAGIEILLNLLLNRLYEVAPLVGAWIEIRKLTSPASCVVVAPLVGAGIEILLASGSATGGNVAPLIGAGIEI
ncbi:hypothetical protein [Bacillus mycoides]|uniref:hypothetical protein n=1 Tax=Bacillus mycoides TaxID=1405 RepID=UPI0038B237B1